MKIRRLHIQNFRAIRRLTADDLGDTVVIAGPNGCGKSQIYHAVRLIKSTYGGHQQNEEFQWWGEFNISLDQSSKDILKVFRDTSRPLTLEADFELDSSERRFMHENAADLIRHRIWTETTPGLRRFVPPRVPSARDSRLVGPQVEQRVEAEVRLIQSALAQDPLRARIVLHPDRRAEINPNPALELLFSTYDPKNLGVIDYHAAQRAYSREQLGSIDLNIRSSNDRFGSSMLYNWQNKYTNIKSELAAAYVRGLITRDAGEEKDDDDLLIDTLQELFSTFFPGKKFVGPVPGKDGTLDFPVELSNGKRHDIDELSSGEQEVLFGYLRLRNSAPRHSVLLIDEPELHLNPALIRGLPEFYHRHVTRALDSQLWLVTHSDGLLRESFDQPEFSVFHMQPAELVEGEQNQLQPLVSRGPLDSAIISLVGDLATYRPSAKVVFFEGGGDTDFDVHVVTTLFPEFAAKVTPISVGSRTNVEKIHELLSQAVTSGALATRFFSITDRDSGDLERESGSFQWDRYHIENYLLEPKYLLQVLNDLQPHAVQGSTEESILKRLRECALNTLPDLVRHEMQLRADRMLHQIMRTNIPRNEREIGAALRGAIQASGERLNNAMQAELSDQTLRENEAVLRQRFKEQLDGVDWLKTFRGRDILKRFTSKSVQGVSYEQLRNLIVARMRDDGFKPVGMSQVLERIVPTK